LADTETPGERDLSIHDHQLPMIPLEHAVWIAETGSVEGAYLNPRPTEGPPIPRRCRPAPYPIIQEPYLDPLASLLDEGIPERPAHRIVSKDVVLEVDVSLRTRDRLQPRVERNGSVELERNRVARDFRRARCSLERLPRQAAETALAGRKELGRGRRP